MHALFSQIITLLHVADKEDMSAAIEKSDAFPGGSRVTLRRDGAEAQLFAFGAQLISWKACDEGECFWVAQLSDHLDAEKERPAGPMMPKPIRGGVPICWPQFANLTDKLPLHGFAREQVWTVLYPMDGLDAADGVARLELTENEATLALWPHKFRLEYTVELLEGGKGIKMTLTVENTGGEEFAFTACLHTYLALDSSAVEVEGLAGQAFIDKCDGMKAKVQHEKQWKVGTEAEASGEEAGKPGYVDRVYAATEEIAVHSIDPTKSDWGRTCVQSPEWPNVTIYNPWQGDKLGGKAAGLDFDEDGYRRILCIEPTVGELEKAVKLEAAGKWVASQTITCGH